MARRLANAPDHQRSERSRRERVAPEADQRVHAAASPGPDVKLADMGAGVAKFYKEVVNAGEIMFS